MPDREKRTPEHVARRFRLFAALCRERASDPRYPANERAKALAQAASWDRDALAVLRDGELIQETRALLAQVEALLVRRI